MPPINIGIDKNSKINPPATSKKNLPAAEGSIKNRTIDNQIYGETLFINEAMFKVL